VCCCCRALFEEHELISLLTDIPLQMLLMMAAQDIRENAAQIVNVEGGDDREETSNKLLAFFESVDNLFVSFPWEMTMTCPLVWFCKKIFVALCLIWFVHRDWQVLKEGEKRVM
jgi:hypothetical protein